MCRDSEVLKSCWDNLKKKTRKFFADERMQLYKTDNNMNSCKLPTISYKNLYEPTTSNNTIIEWFDENITDESTHEDDIQNYLKKLSAASMEKKSPNNVLNIHTAMDYDYGNDINESQNDSDLNTDNLHN